MAEAAIVAEEKRQFMLFVLEAAIDRILKKKRPPAPLHNPLPTCFLLLMNEQSRAVWSICCENFSSTLGTGQVLENSPLA